MLFLSLVSFAQNNDSKPNSRFFANASYGFSWQTASIGPTSSSEEKQFYSDLSNGYGLEFGIGYKLRNKQFLRAIYNNFSSEANFRSLIFGESSMNYYGLSYGVIYDVADRHEFILETGLGYNTLHYKFKDPEFTLHQKGGNIAFNTQASFLFGINNQIKAGPSLSYFAGTLSSVQESINNGPYETFTLNDDERIGIGRFNLVLMLKYNF